jgi:DNA primase
MTWTDEGAPIDRYRDRIMFISRNEQMNPVGLVAVDRDGRVDSLPAENAMFHPSNGLVGPVRTERSARCRRQACDR